MVLGFLARLARVRVTASYAVILTSITIVLMELGPKVQDRVIRHTSTNLHNLSHGHFGTLVGSAFVVDAGPIYIWLPGLVCLLAVAELLWRSGRLLATFAIGHIGATLLVAAGLLTAVEMGWLPWSVSLATDVGMSYGAAAVLGSLTAAIPRRWRPAWIGWLLAVGVAVVAVGRDFTDVGHAVALALGMLVSLAVRRAGALDAGAVGSARCRRGLRIPGAGQHGIDRRDGRRSRRCLRVRGGRTGQGRCTRP